jgi:HPt (histidine-containing phosphotransfer) domain-containing protein
MRKLFARYRDTITMAGFLVLLVAFIGTVLVPGYRLANDLSSDSAALKLVSEQRGQPDVMMRLLAALRDQLRGGAYVGQSLKDLGTAVRQFDAALTRLRESTAQQAPELAEASVLWKQQHALLAPVAGFSGIPYSDSDVAGTRINAAGQELLENSRSALAGGREAMPQLAERMATVGERLEREVADGASMLRRLMIVGVAFAGVLVALLLYFQWLKSRHERAAREAQTQTRDILATVKEGLFLIDSDFRIGKAHSAALGALLRREKFDGMAFDDLLFELVPQKTLDTAMKYVKLLWGERVNENLIKSINPLAEVEVNFDRSHGGRDIRYLEFDFHRVKGDGGEARQVLVSVNDVTSRVLLSRELKESQSSNSVQMDMLLGILKIESRQLVAFLSDSDATLKLINSVLKVPARDDAGFRQKIDQLFREMHKLKGEAAALGLVTVEDRAHAFEDMLKELRERPELTGNDFLPLLVRLDDLFAHFKAVRELIDKLDGLRAAAQVGAIASGLTMAVPTMDSARTPMQRPAQEVTSGLESLAQRIAGETGRKVRFEVRGLEQVPNDYLRTVRAVAIQLVRNAVVHGIEAAEQRVRGGKSEIGTLQLEFTRVKDGYEMVFQDDGIGLVAEHIKQAAVRRGTISADEARTLDGKAAIGLIFRAGFSTQEHESKDAGRGVGLDVVWKTVRGMGGRIAVSTAPGKFTRFKIQLPSDVAQQGAVA